MSDFSYGNRDGRRYKGAPIVAVGAVVDKGVVESVRFLRSVGMTVVGERSVGMTVVGGHSVGMTVGGCSSLFPVIPTEGAE